jgi:hypothetical protein
MLGATHGADFQQRDGTFSAAIDEFEKVAAKYGDPYRSQARYFIASNRLGVDRGQRASRAD